MKQIFPMAAALVCGFVGGTTSTLIISAREHARPLSLIRAQSFEVVDEAGRQISYWGVDAHKKAVIAFGSRGLAVNAHVPATPSPNLVDPNDQVAAMGLLGDDMPFMEMRGADRKARVMLLLTHWGKPLLYMGDQTGPRLSLGLEQSDTPGPQDNDWSLAFYPEVARIGYRTDTINGQSFVQGGVIVKKGTVKYP